MLHVRKHKTNPPLLPVMEAASVSAEPEHGSTQKAVMVRDNVYSQ